MPFQESIIFFFSYRQFPRAQIDLRACRYHRETSLRERNTPEFRKD
jgi:hypothetical protein